MKKKLAVVIPFHSYPEVLQLTLGTLLRQVAPAYDLNIHVGIHANYNHYYHQSLAFFDDIRGIAQVHTVDEIDWMGEFFAHWFRYSVMHAKNLHNLFKAIRFYDWDYLVILDNDLFIKEDFVTKCLERHPDADLVGSYLADREGLNEVARELDGIRIYVLPKLSGWHVLLSRRAFDGMVDDPLAIYPKFIEGPAANEYLAANKAQKSLPVFSDVMGIFLYRVLHKSNLKFGVIPSADFAHWVTHYSESSFNFGGRSLMEKYQDKIRELRDIYNKEFPDGLKNLL